MKEFLKGKRLGIFGKGGAGKSTVTVLLANALAARGYGVIVLDADSTNEGIHRALGLQRAPRPLLDHFGGMVFSGGAVTCPVDDPTPLPGADISLREIGSKYYAVSANGVVVFSAGKVSEMGAGAGCDGPVSKIVRDVRITGLVPEPITLIDFKAGFEDVARGVITSVDRALVVVDPSVAALMMAVRMKHTVELMKAGQRPATGHLDNPQLVDFANRLFRQARIQDVRVILNRVNGAPTESYLRRELLKERIEPIGVLPENHRIAEAWLKGNSLIVENIGLGGIVDALEVMNTM
ncbi:MAG: P-loop NTPase [Bacteroidota bacterium]